jgi:hypothetical protein
MLDYLTPFVQRPHPFTYICPPTFTQNNIPFTFIVPKIHKEPNATTLMPIRFVISSKYALSNILSYFTSSICESWNTTFVHTPHLPHHPHPSHFLLPCEDIHSTTKWLHDHINNTPLSPNTHPKLIVSDIVAMYPSITAILIHNSLKKAAELLPNSLLANLINLLTDIISQFNNNNYFTLGTSNYLSNNSSASPPEDPMLPPSPKP